MQASFDFEVVICGAGPAGAAASLFLSQQGIAHLIIDKAIFPRPKVCGDGITPVCFTILEQVLPGMRTYFKEHAGIKNINKLRIYNQTGKFAEISTSDYLPEAKNNLHTVSRTVFDNYLVESLRQRPEASYWDDTKINDYTLTEDGIALQLAKQGSPLTIRCKMVIAADGDRSVFRKKIIGTSIERQQMVAAIRTYYTGVTPIGNNDQLEVFALKEVLPGYLWIFPMEDGTYNVGLGITSDVIQANKINLRKLQESLLATHPMLAHRFTNAKPVRPIEGSGLPIMMEKHPQLSAERVLLTGDAASVADPISGEGIGPGLVSGKYAALVAADALKANDYSAAFLQQYDTIIHKKITNPYELRIKFFDWFIKHPWKIDFLIWTVPRISWLRNFFTNTMNNRFTVKELKNPLKWFKIFGTASK